MVAYGADLPEAFANAAYAMFSLIADLEGVREDVSKEVGVVAPDRESLLVEWLNELLFLFDAEHLLLKRFQIHELTEVGEPGRTDSRLRATVWGEPVDLARHRLKMGIKAVTYHMLGVECSGEGCRAQVVFDV